MATISVNYAALAAGHDGLVATWSRIEGHLAELETVVGGTSDMSAEALRAFVALKQRWSAAAQDRQVALQGLAALVKEAGEHYRSVDAALAAQFT
jgi:uncharacterized protein YukE